MAMATINDLPATIAGFSATIAALPSQLGSNGLNLTLLAGLLKNLSASIEPALPALAEAQVNALLTNATWLEQQTGALSAVIGQINPQLVSELSHDSLIDLIIFGATKFSILTIWSPDVCSIFYILLLVFIFKFSSFLLLLPSIVRRAVDTDAVKAREKQDGIRGSMMSMDGGMTACSSDMSEREVQAMVANRYRAQHHIRRKATSMVTHGWNLIIGSVALCLQLAAYGFFAVSAMPFNFNDAQLAFLSFKIINLSYCLELVFSSPNWEIVMHHCLTVIVITMGAIVSYKTNSPTGFLLGQWWLLQATLEQPTYLSMLCYHTSGYLELLDSAPGLRQRLLRSSSALMWFTKYWSWPQKFVPIAMAIYWLARMWTQQEEDGPIGRFWLGWCLVTIVLLISLQFIFCDRNHALFISYLQHAHLRSKVEGTGQPRRASREGPVFEFIISKCFRRSSSSSSVDRSRLEISGHTLGRDPEKGSEIEGEGPEKGSEAEGWERGSEEKRSS